MILRVFLLLLAFNLLAKADDRLIQIECHNANAPETCIQCLKSDNRSVDADKFSIATLIIDCLDKHARNLVGKVSALAHTNDSRKEYEDCVKFFSQAKKELGSAAKEINNGDYDSADRHVFNARTCNSLCYSKIGKDNSNPKVPADLYSEMKDFEDLSEAAMRIIERF